MKSPEPTAEMNCPTCRAPAVEIRVAARKLPPKPDPKGQHILTTCMACGQFIGYRPAELDNQRKRKRQDAEIGW